MALPSPLYISWEGVETYFVDRDTGLPLSAGYVKFFRDVARTVPKDVYQQVQLPNNDYSFVNIGSIVPLSAVGTFSSPNDGTDIRVWAFPWTGDEEDPGEIDLYFLQVFSSGNISQFTREAEPPNAQDLENIATFTDSENQIENPQFVDVFSPQVTVYTVTGTQETVIAPDWSILTTGSGTVTVSQENNTDITMPSGAPFALKIASAGISSLKLRQRFFNSPRLFDNSYVSSSFVAKSFLATIVPLTMDYVPSSGATVNLVTGATTDDGQYTTSLGTTVLITSTNADGGLTGYVDIIITIPVLASIGITSIQALTVQDANDSSEFIQISTLRQKDHLFSYYKNPLKFKPIPSYLVGWDFTLNPAQINGDNVGPLAVGANKAFYAWDQTIIFQTVDNSVQVTRNSMAIMGNGAIALRATIAGQNAMIQYLLAPVATDILLNRLSSMIDTAARNAPINATVSLWFTDNVNLPVLPNVFFTGLDANGRPTGIASGWVEIPRPLVPTNASFTSPVYPATTDDGYQDIPLSGWYLNDYAAAGGASFFAIVVGTETMAVDNQIGYKSISLNAGSIPTIPAPQTAEQVLRECQAYYERSYGTGVLTGSTAAKGAVLCYQQSSAGGGVDSGFAAPFGVRYAVNKVQIPGAITLYSPSAGTVNRADPILTQQGTSFSGTPVNTATFWTLFDNGKTGFSYTTSATGGNTAIVTNTVVGAPVTAAISFQYTCDARLGM